ncbi:MAG: hypothetical protein Q9184_003950 [Pyrenodesmia sp. 2 TL-2023]
MPDLRHAVMNVRWPDSRTTSDVVTAEEWEEFVGSAPTARINLADEEGKVRKDTITFEEVRSSSQTTLDALFKAWSQLQYIMDKYQTTLQNRWSKKTTKQRTEILLQAWPKMSRVHRPDFDLFRKERKTKGYHQQNRLATDIALRFPFINTEDLSQPKPLLLMLHSRSRHFPCVFVNADRDSIRVGIRSKMLIPKYIRGYTMYLNGEQTREKYGRLVSWENDRQAIHKCVRGIAPDPGIGLMILEIQRDILELLVACSVRILHVEFPAGLTGLPSDTSSDASILQRTLLAEDKISSALVTSHDSVATHALEAHYRTPDAYDFTRLRSFVEAKCCEVKDHFHLVREDPAYFADLMREACSHTGEATVNRQYDPFSTRLSDRAWNEALYRVLMPAYHDTFLWGSVSRLFDQLMITYTEQKSSIQPGQILPDAYMEVFSRLGHILDSITERYLKDLPYFMAAVPTFKQHVVNTFQPNGEVLSTINRKSADHLYWLFTELALGAKGNQQICGLPNLSQEMENLITKDAQQKERLTWRLTRFISDVAVIAEMQRQLGLSTCNEYTLSAFSQEENDAWVKDYVGPLAEINKVFYYSIGLAEANGLAPLVTDLRTFDYPSDKPRTAANTAKMRSAEYALKSLWEKVDERFVLKTGKTLKELGEGKIQHRDIQITPPWTDPQHSTMERRGKDKSIEDLDVSLALTTLEERTESTIDPSKPSAARQKVKTRGQPIDHAESDDPEPPPAIDYESTAAEAPGLSVKKKAFSTFAALFGKPIADKLPGELPWTDFKKAMVNVGFGAEKLQGSGWLFESKSSSIIFHEPHPQSKLPMQWARRIARRLNRNFRWTADTFVLEDRTDNGNANLATS